MKYKVSSILFGTRYILNALGLCESSDLDPIYSPVNEDSLGKDFIYILLDDSQTLLCNLNSQNCPHQKETVIFVQNFTVELADT